MYAVPSGSYGVRSVVPGFSTRPQQHYLNPRGSSSRNQSTSIVGYPPDTANPAHSSYLTVPPPLGTASDYDIPFRPIHLNAHTSWNGAGSTSALLPSPPTSRSTRPHIARAVPSENTRYLRSQMRTKSTRRSSTTNASTQSRKSRPLFNLPTSPGGFSCLSALNRGEGRSRSSRARQPDSTSGNRTEKSSSRRPPGGNGESFRPESSRPSQTNHSSRNKGKMRPSEHALRSERSAKDSKALSRATEFRESRYDSRESDYSSDEWGPRASQSTSEFMMAARAMGPRQSKAGANDSDFTGDEWHPRKTDTVSKPLASKKGKQRLPLEQDALRDSKDLHRQKKQHAHRSGYSGDAYGDERDLQKPSSSHKTSTQTAVPRPMSVPHANLPRKGNSSSADSRILAYLVSNYREIMCNTNAPCSTRQVVAMELQEPKYTRVRTGPREYYSVSGPYRDCVDPAKTNSKRAATELVISRIKDTDAFGAPLLYRQEFGDAKRRTLGLVRNSQQCVLIVRGKHEEEDRTYNVMSLVYELSGAC